VRKIFHVSRMRCTKHSRHSAQECHSREFQCKRILDGVLRFVLFQEEVSHDLDQALHHPVLLQVFAELLPFQANGVLFDQEEILVGLRQQKCKKVKHCKYCKQEKVYKIENYLCIRMIKLHSGNCCELKISY
jgi:hypothetical protein